MSELFIALGKAFFEIMQNNLEARAFLNYDSCLTFKCEGKLFIIGVKDKQIQSISEGGERHPLGLMDLLIEADAQVFSDLFRGRISPANAFYYGKLRIADQKSKHSQVVALFQAIRKNQEDLYKKDWS